MPYEDIVYIYIYLKVIMYWDYMKIFKQKKRQQIKGVVRKENPTQAVEEVKKAPKLEFQEFYTVNEPFGHVGILIDPKTKRITYHVIEPMLNDFERAILNEVIRVIKEEDVIIPIEILRDPKEKENYLRNRVFHIIKRYKFKLEEASIEKLTYYVLRDMLGYGKLDVIMRDEKVEDVSCDGINVPIYVWHKDYESMPTNVVFNSIEELESYVMRLAYLTGHQISAARPIVEGMLPEGYRLHATLSDISRRGPTFTIRKFMVRPLTIVDLVELGTLSSELAAYLWILIEHKRTVVICGAMASGKTTTLNAIASFIKPEMKIVTIEETPELNIPHENWVPMVTRPAYQAGVEDIDLFDLLKASLRQRPDYIIVGEIRGEEAYTLIQAVAVGHGGLCTLHAESIDTAIRRLESKPMAIPRSLIPLINVMMLTERLEVGDKIVRRVTEVTEIDHYDSKTNEIVLNPLFSYDMASDRLQMTRRSVILNRIASMRGETYMDVLRDLERRKVILEWMVRRKIKSWGDVAEVIRFFYRNPDYVFELARGDVPW